MTTETLQTQDWFFSAPYRYLEDERLDIYDKMVYTVLCAHASAASKTAFPSAKTIAKEGGLGRTKVFECLKKLEQLGYIKRKQRFKVTEDEKTKKKKISNDTNQYTLVLPSTHGELPPSTHGELVHVANHLPSSSGELVHTTDYVPSSRGEHITDIDLDFDYDLDNDLDRQTVHNLSIQLFKELVVTYKDLTLLQVCETMKRCIDHNPADLYKYAMKAVIKDINDILNGKPKKVNAANLKRKPQPKRKGKAPIRTEVTQDWEAEYVEERRLADEKRKQEQQEDKSVEEKQREIEDILKGLRK